MRNLVCLKPEGLQRPALQEAARQPERKDRNAASIVTGFSRTTAMPHRQLHTELESMQQPISHRHEKRDPKANQQLPQKNCELPEKVGSLDCKLCGATALP